MLGLAILVGDFVLWASMMLSGVDILAVLAKGPPVTIRLIDVERIFLIVGVIIGFTGVIQAKKRKR